VGVKMKMHWFVCSNKEEAIREEKDLPPPLHSSACRQKYAENYFHLIVIPFITFFFI